MEIKPRLWADEIVEYLAEMGGSATLKDLYEYVEQAPKRLLRGDFRATIRRTIYEHSSDAVTVWGNGKQQRDLFALVGALGDGHWALRRNVPTAAVTIDPDRFAEDVDPNTPLSRRLRLQEYVLRDRALVEKLKAACNYTCERCNVPASWTREDGKLYVEGHHLIPLGEEGDDSAANIIVLCASCHRMIHYGVDGRAETARLLADRSWRAHKASYARDVILRT